MAGNYTDGYPTLSGASASNWRRPTGGELVPVDTQLGGGRSPQTVAASMFQIAALAGPMIVNTGTTSSDAVTLNTLGGMITSESKTTAAGATFAVTLTNSAIAATSTVQAVVFPRTNTVPGAYVQSIAPAAGSVVITIANGGTAAFNGTMVIPFLVVV